MVTAIESSFAEPQFVEPSFVEPRSVSVPRAEVERRLATFQETLRAEGIDAAIVSQNADLYYLAGTVQQSQLLVPADDEPVLFTRRTVARAREESPLTVAELPSPRRLGELVAEWCGGAPDVVGLELDELPVLSRNDRLLERGMVFALEPKFVFPGLGAIGIENTWAVTADGVERLTRAPEEIVVL